MELWQSALFLLSLWVLIGVGASVAKRNWNRLAHSSVIQTGGATLMADEWRLSSEARVLIRHAFWLLIGVFLAGEGVVFSAIGIYTVLFT